MNFKSLKDLNTFNGSVKLKPCESNSNNKKKLIYSVKFRPYEIEVAEGPQHFQRLVVLKAMWNAIQIIEKSEIVYSLKFRPFEIEVAEGPQHFQRLGEITAMWNSIQVIEKYEKM